MSSTTPESLRPPLPALLRRPWSIAGRLTLLYVGSTAAILVLAAGYLYTGLQDGLARQDRALVTGKLEVMRLLLEEHRDKTEALASEVEHEAAANSVLKYYLRVLDARGRVILETPDMGRLLPASLFPEPPAAVSSLSHVTTRRLNSGRSYLVLTGSSGAGPQATERRTLQIALDVGHNDSLLADYRWKLLATLAAGIALAAGTGILITRAGLRPLRHITRATQTITASKLNDRLIATEWPAELHELATAFDAMLDRLEESFNRLTAFSSDLAHALRNPINNLRGETEVALNRARTPAEYHQILGSSLEEFERLSHMIEALLFIARSDNPHAVLERVRFPVRHEMDAVREFYEGVAAERDVTVTCEGEASLTGDPMLVRRALSNLLGNALKHTPARGVITLAAHAESDHSVSLTVTDTGAGIAAEDLPKVFDRFYQVDRTRGPEATGAGLGLAIVKSIMRLHGGVARIESTLGRGTKVTLTFPAADERS
ncbi:heavy metal sensor histidine kinase [Horticoccus sp. 23ND18S-11]|uniref:heavy metal sensor histidine kinase n=1 Tax=Horticoccus sp. 23ND18S-11 TaxID=3391832 RepID=UPI0039C93765